MKARAIADEIGAHRDQDVDLRLSAAARFEEKLYELRGFLTPARLLSRIAVGGALDAAKADQLLKLVDQDEDRTTFHVVEVGDRLDQSEARMAERIGDALAACRVDGALVLVTAHWRRAGERVGQAADRAVARAQLEAFPVPAAGLDSFLMQEWQQAGAHQGRLAAAGCSHHRDEAAAIEQAVDGIDLVVAAKEEGMVGKAERPQPGKRPHVRQRSHLHVGYSGCASSLRTRFRSLSG